MNTKLAAALFGLTLALSAPAFAAVAPLSPRDQKQSDDEVKQGAAASAAVNKEAKLVKDPAVLLRVDTIGQKLAAVANSDQIPALFGNNKVYPFKWHFFVIEDKDVNAFSLPGGYVYINSGLLKMVRSDDELAGVLGHEITHSEHHHLQTLSHEQSKMTTEMMGLLLAALVAHVNSRDMANVAAGAQYAQMGVLNTRYSQAAERDADHGGTIFMTKAGYNPVGMLTFMQLLQQIGDRGPAVELGILQDHPLTPDRVSAITAQLKEMHIAITPQSVREATGAPRATVHQAVGGGEEIEYAGKTLPALSDPDDVRAKAAIAQFNTLLDTGLSLYQISASGPQVLVSDRPIITMTAADAGLHPGATPETLARLAADALRGGLYSQTFRPSNVPGSVSEQ